MTKWTKEQEEAIKKSGTNIIVSAGAGSGKTAVLSERVINKLNSGININGLLILTFTKAAAFEMQERIRNKIIENKNLSSQLDLIDNSYITTFDSFALSIVKKYHYLYNIDPYVSIADSNIVLIEKRKIIDDIFNELYIKKDRQFQKLIKDFCVKNDKEIKSAILKISNKLEMKVNYDDYLDNYIDTYFNDKMINNNIKQYEDILINEISSLNNMLSLLKTYTDTTYYEKVLTTLTPIIESNNYQDIKNNLNITIPRLPNGSTEELKTIKTNISNLITNLQKATKYDNINQMKDEYLLTKDYVEIIIKIIKELHNRINQYKNKNDIYEFNDIALLAIKIIKENEPIKEEIKNSFKEIMIDEYQDTNDYQDLFISLISNNNTYVVGDIKQSIYRFRNANPSNFKMKYDLYKNNQGGYKIDLNKNFRSRKEILDDINKIFNLIMSDNLGQADYLKEHQMIFGNNSYIEEGKTNQKYGLQIYNYHKIKDYSSSEIEAFIIANDIKNKIKNKYQVFDKDLKILRDVKLSDFVILIDRSSNFETYKKILEYLNIQTVIEKDEDITDEIEINVIKNLLNLIIKIKKQEFDTQFKYYFVSIARSFLFEYDDNKIFDCFKNNNFKDNDIYKKAYLISLKLDSLSINSILNNITKMFDLYSKLIKIGSLEERIIRIDYLFNLAGNLSKLGYDIYKYTDHITDIINGSNQIKFSLNTTSGDAVKITTIHKSKGLEYHICYFPGFDKEFNLDDLKDKFIYDNKYGIVAPYFKEGIGTTFYKDLVKNKYMLEEISEKIRLLYVAFTRAKENMIIVTELKDNLLSPKNSDGVIDDSVRLNYHSFNDIISSLYNYIDDYVIDYDLDSINISKDYKKIKKINYKDYIPLSDSKLDIKSINVPNIYISESSFSKESNELIKNNDYLKLGTYIHYLFEMIDFKNPNLDSLNIDKFYKDKIRLFLNSDLMKNVQNAKIYKEYEFMYELDDNVYHGIIDLMMEYDSHIDIIDYKLKNIDDIKYFEQLNGYKKYIEDLTNKRVNIYLYSILDNKINELSYHV